jgi:hypothetical protein
MSTNLFVFRTRERNQVSTAPVLTLAEVGRRPGAKSELVCFRLELFVRIAEGGLGLHGLRN